MRNREMLKCLSDHHKNKNCVSMQLKNYVKVCSGPLQRSRNV